MERNLPTFGVAPLRAWLDKRCEKKVAKWEPVPAPTEPLPWEHFRRMPKRLKGGRRHAHHGIHIADEMAVPNVYSGEPLSSPAVLGSLCSCLYKACAERHCGWLHVPAAGSL